MQRENALIFSLLFVAVIFYMWLCLYLGFNVLESAYDFLLSCVWWFLVTFACLGIRWYAKTRRSRASLMLGNERVAASPLFLNSSNNEKNTVIASPVLRFQAAVRDAAVAASLVASDATVSDTASDTASGALPYDAMAGASLDARAAEAVTQPAASAVAWGMPTATSMQAVSAEASSALTMPENSAGEASLVQGEIPMGQPHKSFVVCTSKFDSNSNSWEGEVLATSARDFKTISFSSREELVNIIQK